VNGDGRSGNWASAIPIASVLVASLAAGGVVAEIRAMKDSLHDLSVEVKQIGVSIRGEIADLRAQVAELQRWKAQHQQLSDDFFKDLERRSRKDRP